MKNTNRETKKSNRKTSIHVANRRVKLTIVDNSPPGYSNSKLNVNQNKRINNEKKLCNGYNTCSIPGWFGVGLQGPSWQGARVESMNQNKTLIKQPYGW
jgi:hypothetical protein